MALGRPNIYPGIIGEDSRVRRLEVRIAELDGLWPQHSLERWFLAIAEEAGEAVGAFNKWHNGYKTKPRTKEDVIEEMSQLMACVLAAAGRLGYSPGNMMEQIDLFIGKKIAQIEEIRRQWPDA